MQTFILRGLPRGLARDAWWMSDAVADVEEVAQDAGGTRGGRLHSKDPALWALALLIALLILADWLFWERYIGISLAGFALVLHGCLWILTRDEATPRSTAFHLATALASVLPSVELVQTLSVLFLIAGLMVNAARVALGDDGLEAGIWRAVMRLPLTPVFALSRDLRTVQIDLPAGVGLVRLAHRWGLPLVGSLFFISLFAMANPVLETWLTRFLRIELELPGVMRLLFWALLGAVLWPLLVPRRQYALLTGGRQVPLTGTLPGANDLSIANGLIVFNLLMFGQNMLDAATLLGAIALPDDMTLSQYVRKGAYTLIATAMLAGGFAIAARPFVKGSARLSGLLYIWLAQNAVLVLSGGYRLGLVIEAHGLSHMRIYGGLWMLVVLVGLGLIAWQIAKGRSTGWLWQRNFAVVAGVLYLCCFVNFGHIIAASQIERGSVSSYMCTLGVHSAGAFKGRSFHECDRHFLNGPVFHSWFDWGFRDARVRAYLVRE